MSSTDEKAREDAIGMAAIDNPQLYPTITLPQIEKIYRLTSPANEREYFSWSHKTLVEAGWIGDGEKPQLPWMFIDLAEFESAANYIAQLRKIHKGNNVRDAARAEKHGYYSHFFNPKNHLDDMLGIANSAPERQGTRLTERYFRTPEEWGGYPERVEPEETPTGALGWDRWLGLFYRTPGHRQGPLLLDEQLVAFGHLRRYNTTIIIDMFIGHADHWSHGIMHKLHMDLVDILMRNQGIAYIKGLGFDASLRGLRYILNSGVTLGQPGSLRWKLRVLYRPGYFLYETAIATGDEQ